MLHARLAVLEAQPVSDGEPWLVSALLALGLAGLALLAWPLLGPLAGALLGVGALAAAALAAARRGAAPAFSAAAVAPPADLSLVAASLSLCSDPAALTDAEGSLLSVNQAYRTRFPDCPPPAELGTDEAAAQALSLARQLAWRDGQGCAAGIDTPGGPLVVEVERVGLARDNLLWRFPRPRRSPLSVLAARLSGFEGDVLSQSGVLAAAVDDEGAVVAANALFENRTRLSEAGSARLDGLLIGVSDGRVRLAAEGEEGPVLRLLHVPADPSTSRVAGLSLLFASVDAPGLTEPASLQALLDLLPLGLALVDRDGRFLTSNKSFRVAAALGEGPLPAFPSDLVVKEDKAAVADAVRRNSRGPAMSGDLAVRLAHQPTEPVALTIAGLRNLGEASVLLLLKDNSEEAKLKRQVAQATKMQAVGQLAGGVAHDFNNILTAIIGHCDLMLMRHTPGDSDYEDIQQIKSNSNRAAGLSADSVRRGSLVRQSRWVKSP